VRLRHPTPVVGARARMHCGGAIADPKADGRPGQDGSAGCTSLARLHRAGELTALQALTHSCQWQNKQNGPLTREVAGMMQSTPAFVATIIGKTDSVGSV
jgi:hypothetical protein